MYSFNELRKASKIYVDGKEIKIAVLGNCSTQFFGTAVVGYAKLSGLNVNLYDTDYNQIDFQLLEKCSEIYNFDPDIILFWLATEKLYEEFLILPIKERERFAEFYMQKICNYWKLVENNFCAKIIQFNFTEIDDKVLGQYSCKVESTFVFQIRKLNYLLQEEMRKNDNIYPVDLLAIQIQRGQTLFFDAPLYYNAKMSVAINTIPFVAKAVVDVLQGMFGKTKKCIILDLDNTLWGGVIGDDGLSNIEIGQLGKGHVFTNFQKWLKQLKEYGILLAVCSKNNEEIAKEPFEKHGEMVLKLSDISVFVANWDDKATNVQAIQESLNIGMDSLVFIDDNPFERNLVRQMIPQITVPELPEDPALYLGYLQQCNYFDTISYTEDSSKRTIQYQAEFQRKKLELTFETIDDYLKNLEMIGEANKFESVYFSRIAQLTQRSNQFNLRTIRYTESEIRKIADSERYITFYYTLKDKFGDHGLVSIVILEKKSDKELFIDTWLMSCRVLKRGMEEFVVNHFMEVVKEKGFRTIFAEYIPTQKNKMVKDIYKTMGFNRIRENEYCIDVYEYHKKLTYIKENR